MERLNVMIDSQSIKTVAATLLYLADQAELNIIVSGTPEECGARKTEIETLLAHSRYHQPTFGFAVSIDFSAMRGAAWRNIYSATAENYALKLRGDIKRGDVKLHDFGFRGTK